MKINKYFLLQNKKLKPWIKYWLYIKSKDKNYVLSDILDGTSFYLENSSNKNFNLFQINGNSVQDGTPTPTNPVEIESSGDGINLFDKDNAIILNAFVNGNTGLLTTPTNNQKSIAVRVYPNTTYTISGVERSSSNYGIFDDTLVIETSIATVKGNISNGRLTFTTGNNSKWFVFLLGGGAETYGYNNVQLQKGSTATEFVSYGEGYINITISNSDNTQNQNFTIPCQQPMRSIGDIRDEFVKQDGVWYEKHNLRERILVGNENWISQAQSGFYRYGLADSVINNETSYASQIIIKSDSFKGITFNNRNSDTNETIYAVSNAQQHNLFINTKSYITLNDFKDWLTGNNIKVIYLLNEPNYIECTQEQVQVLESITQAHTYKHITNINSTDITPAFLKIQYYMEV